jgi:phosphoribosylglycinamide formyltransferase-1
VLASGNGSLLQVLIDAQRDGTLGARVVGVGADRRAARALDRAAGAGVATFVHPYVKGTDRVAWDDELTRLVAGYTPDLVVSAGFMKLVGARFLERFSGRMINTHPALLPAFPGMHGVRDALAHGVKITGATVFVVDAGVDAGPILAQAAVPVEPGDTLGSLHERIKVAERAMLLRTVADFAAGRLPLPYPTS